MGGGDGATAAGPMEGAGPRGAPGIGAAGAFAARTAAKRGSTGHGGNRVEHRIAAAVAGKAGGAEWNRGDERADRGAVPESLDADECGWGFSAAGCSGLRCKAVARECKRTGPGYFASETERRGTSDRE